MARPTLSCNLGRRTVMDIHVQLDVIPDNEMDESGKPD